jgi:tRNA/rRNA methyltransferase
MPLRALACVSVHARVIIDAVVDRTVPRSLHAADPPSLARVAFVLVHSSHPGNVGAAARAMCTMGLSDLRLVGPRHSDVLRHPETHAFASGATGVLARATLFATLGEAIGDSALAIAVSAEPREFGPPPWPPEIAAADALDVLQASPAHRVAFVFGAERTGLSIAQVQACGRLIGIPASPGYASLNLAQAVQVVAYCVRREALARAGAAASLAQAPDGHDEPLADQAAIQGLIGHLERVLVLVGFLDPEHPRKLVPRLRRLMMRARLRAEEVDLLRGVCTQIERRGPR